MIAETGLHEAEGVDEAAIAGVEEEVQREDVGVDVDLQKRWHRAHGRKDRQRHLREARQHLAHELWKADKLPCSFLGAMQV